MAVRKINDFSVGDTNFTAMMETLNKAYKGQSQITISEYDTDLEPVVKVGSVFDCNGSQILVESGDETPTGYSGISDSTTFYLYYDESAEEFIYNETAPAWNDILQGWYNGNDRALFSMYKDSGGTLYESKTKLQNPNKTQNIIGYNVIASNYGYIFTSGTYPVNSIGATGSNITTNYAKAMECYCPGIGVAQIRFGIRTSLAGNLVYGKIYLNGVAVGIERSTTSNSFVYFTEDINVRLGDQVEIWIRKTATGTAVAGDLQIRVSNTTTPKHIISTLFDYIVTESYAT